MPEPRPGQAAAALRMALIAAVSVEARSALPPFRARA
jgi:hypothetical protein